MHSGLPHGWPSLAASRALCMAKLCRGRVVPVIQFLFSLDRKAPRYFGRRKSPAKTRRLLLGPVGTGVGAPNQAASAIRGATVTPHANRTLVGPVHRTRHADRTLVGPGARLVLMMTCGCKCERTGERERRG
jgi:hypothetical protein